MKAFDNTTLSDFKRCMRYGYFRHIRGWTTEGVSPPLLFGRAWHAAMDTLWRCHSVDAAYAAFLEVWREEAPYPVPPAAERYWSPRLPSVAKLMLEAYAAKRAKNLENFRLVSAEERFEVPLADEVRYVGRRDKAVEAEGRIFILEHKTTTLGGPKGFRDSWLNQWSPNSQIDGYIYSASLKYGRTVPVWIDGALVSTSARAFTLIAVRRTAEQIEGWLAGARWWAARILEQWRALGSPRANFVSPEHPETERREGEAFLAFFPQNTENCIRYGSPCPYLGICKSHANPERLAKPPAGLREEYWRA